MTTVNVTATNNTVTVTENNSSTVVQNQSSNTVTVTASGSSTVVQNSEAATVNVTESSTSTVVQTPVTTTVTATTAGPQGPRGETGSGFTLDATAKVDKSVIYYDSSSGEFKADTTWTVETIVLGGNF
tara:strand:- start:1896 stop:2279 length:384 start_codon:yes stop_codon:yes gene_type:complete